MKKGKDKKYTELPRLRYGVMYFRSGSKYPYAWGSTETFPAACGNAARHVSRSDFFDSEYSRAVIWDKHAYRVVRVYNRTKDGISIRDKDE